MTGAVLIQIVQAAMLAVQILLARSLFAAVLHGGASLGPALGPAFWPILTQLSLLIGLQLVIAIVGVYQSEQQLLLSELVQRYAARPVIEVASTVELKYFDSPSFHDSLMRAYSTATSRPLQVTSTVIGLGRSLLGIGGLGAGLYILSPLLLSVTLVGIVPALMVRASLARTVYRFVWKMTANDRRRSYVLGLATERQWAKEVRAFGLGPYLRDLYERLSDERLSELRRHMRRRAVTAAAGSVSTTLMSAVILAAVGWLLINRKIDLAQAGAATLAALQLSGLLQGIVASASQLFESALFLDDLDSFRGLLTTMRAERPTGVLPEGFLRIELVGVDFSYHTDPEASLESPSTMWPIHRSESPTATRPAAAARQRQALRGVSLRIQQGEVVALVGENGSGKTTLANLISGLYQPDAGAVLWNGMDVARIDPDQLRSQVTVIFQDYARYLLTVRENIGFGRIENLDDVEGMELAAREAGADAFIESLPDRYDTVLSPAFPRGQDLSTGQWQRIALARAFFRDAPLIILDEPTASLDARAEADLFKRIRTLFKRRSVLLISHRFSSVRSADRIYVLKEGQVVEHGNHNELMQLGGLYAELFSLQANAYVGVS